MSNFKIRSLRWLAPVALVGALGLAACGDEDATVSAAPASAGVVSGSDRHLENLSADIAERMAERAAGRAEAERYVQLQQDRAQASSGKPSGEFVPGSRHMPAG
jgi:hypothetical protein